MSEVHTHKPQIFKNPALEALTKTSPLITFSTYGSVVALFFYLTYREGVLGVGSTAFIYLCGLFFWTFFEYIMHRYLFHLPSEGKAAKAVTYALHGVHHEDPRDHDRLFMPPVPGLLIIGVVGLIAKLVLGVFAFPFLAGWLTGYMIYAYIHYKVHEANPPKVLKRMWIHHNMHHYRYPDKAYGVSSPLWDIIFGTMPPDPDKARNSKDDAREKAPMYVIHSKV